MLLLIPILLVLLSMRRGRRLATPVCWGCGYIIQGLTGSKCPECGLDLEDNGVQVRRIRRSRFFLPLCVLISLPLVTWAIDELPYHVGDVESAYIRNDLKLSERLVDGDGEIHVERKPKHWRPFWRESAPWYGTEDWREHIPKVPVTIRFEMDGKERRSMTLDQVEALEEGLPETVQKWLATFLDQPVDDESMALLLEVIRTSEEPEKRNYEKDLFAVGGRATNGVGGIIPAVEIACWALSILLLLLMTYLFYRRRKYLLRNSRMPISKVRAGCAPT